MVTIYVLSVSLIVVVLVNVYKNSNRNHWKQPEKKLALQHQKILIKKVKFYNKLTPTEKLEFEYKVEEFLINVEIIGVDTTVDEIDKVLIAASAIIPIFAFKNWQYQNLKEVILYPDNFNMDFKTSGPLRNIKGLVGTGYMEGKMLLSKAALHHGFSNETDKRNTAIHEFIHLIDKADGLVDGIPTLLLEEPNQIPWLEYIYQQIALIKTKQSDIHEYGATNEMEFFSVAGEYFFERPKLLEKKHPELYQKLEHIFKQDMAERFR
ncbi:MAG: zinc-dependent peptidase [Flavobacteriales bacterium]|jgi:Mlc titration factor MtfA (ptsG expression regulator)|nr:zinc-dependent peptidase [Flavobacteriales bacterium]